MYMLLSYPSSLSCIFLFFFFFNDTATTEIYTLSLHDALPIPALATVSLGKAALRSAATMLGADLEPDGIRVATLTIAGRIVAGTAFDPERIAERYWDVVQTDGPWQAEFRFTGE